MEPRVLQLDDRGAGEPVVLVPGGLTGWVSWLPHQEQLARTYRVIRVQPMHNELGSQGVPGDSAYSTDIERESLRLTLDALGLERPHLAGWSAGGSAVLEFVLEYPERVRSLILVEPAAYWILGQLGERHDEIDTTTGLLNRLFGRAVTEEELAQFLRFGGLAADDENPRSHPNWSRWLEHRMTLSWLAPLNDRPGRSIDDLHGVTAPTLLTKGTASSRADRRLVDILGERLPQATVREFEGDHAHHLEQPDAFIDALYEHLATS